MVSMIDDVIKGRDNPNVDAREKRMQKGHAWWRPGRRLIQITVSVLVLLAILAGVLAWQVPKQLRSALTGPISQKIGRPIDVGPIQFNPFTLSLRVADLVIEQPGGPAPLFKVAHLQVSLSWSSLFWVAPVIDQLSVDAPQIYAVRDGKTHFSFSDIVDRLTAPTADQPKPAADTGPFRFSLNNFTLKGGAITLDDKVAGRQQVIDQISFAVPFVSTFGYATQVRVQPYLHLRINGSPLEARGHALPFADAPTTSLDVKLTNLELDKWATAWPVPLPVTLPHALLDSDLQVQFIQPKLGEPRVRILGNVSLHDLLLQQTGGAPLLQWQALRLTGIDASPLQHQVRIGQIALDTPQADVDRDAQGLLNWQRVAQGFAALGASDETPAANRPVSQVAPSAPSSGVPDSAVAPARPGPTAGAAAVSAGVPGVRKAPTPAPASTPWQLSVGSVVVNQGTVRVNDAATSLTYALTGLTLQAGPINVPQPANERVAVQFSTATTGAGQVKADGVVRIAPLDVGLDVQASGMDLMPFAAAVRKTAPVEIGAGKIGVSAHLSLQQAASGIQTALSQVQVSADGLQAQVVSVKPAVKLALGHLQATADHLVPGAGNTAFTLAASGVQGKGSVSMKGQLTQQPLSVSTDLDLSNLDLASFAPFVASRLNATVKSMDLSAKGQAQFSPAQTGHPMSASWKGDAQVSNLDMIDRVNQADFLRWSDLSLSGMAISVAGTQPPNIGLGMVRLRNFYGRVILNDKAHLNVMDLVVAPGQAGGSITQDTQSRRVEPTEAKTNASTNVNTKAGARASSEPAPVISLAGVTFSGGQFIYSDRFVKPNYTAELSAVQGSVGAVSSARPAPAKVDVSGRVYRTAPLRVWGSVQPFSKYLSLDLKVTTKGVDLPSFTTYSAKYVGYPIKSGKLSANLGYKIENRKLTASNEVVLTQLTFGDKTDSPDATKLPVMLAVALLKDASGNIDINLPISGSLDDPQFSVGGIILRVLINLVAKAVTAPFQLLASAFGGGSQHLSYVEFEPGDALLTPSADESLDTLIKAINNRPALKLTVIGRVDPSVDADGLRHAWLDDQIRAAMGSAKPKGGASVALTDAQRDKYLPKAYSNADIKNKPRNLIGLAKSVPPEQMTELLLAGAPVGPPQYEALARARASAVMTYLSAHGLPVNRMALGPPQLTGSGLDDGGSGARVQFSLSR